MTSDCKVQSFLNPVNVPVLLKWGNLVRALTTYILEENDWLSGAGIFAGSTGQEKNWTCIPDDGPGCIILVDL